MGFRDLHQLTPRVYELRRNDILSIADEGGVYSNPSTEVIWGNTNRVPIPNRCELLMRMQCSLQFFDQSSTLDRDKLLFCIMYDAFVVT